jgi:hypothetical protein
MLRTRINRAVSTIADQKRRVKNHFSKSQLHLLDTFQIVVYKITSKSILLDILVGIFMKNLIQLPSEFDYNLLLHALRDYKKPRDKIRNLIRDKDIIRVKKGLYVLGKEYDKPYNKFVLANLIYGPSYITGQTALAFWNMIPERVELMISMTAKRKKEFETPIGRFSYLYSPKKVFNIGIQLEDTGDKKKFLIASPEKALCDITAMQTHISTKKEMKEFLELMRLDYSAKNKPDLSLLEEIKNGYKKQNINLLVNCLKEEYV